MKAYSGIASIYDSLMHEDVDYNKWIEFMVERLPKKKSNILELACGTGNITLGLAKLGHQMTGLDISEEMLTIASQKTSLYNIKWINQNIEELSLKPGFDCVLCPCDGFNYVIDAESLKAVFISIRDLLVEGGTFVFDLSTKYKLKNILGNNTFAESHEDMAYIWENFYDEKSSICEFEVTTFERQGELFNKSFEYHEQRAYEVPHIIEMLLDVGFEDISVNHGYSNNTDIPTEAQRVVFSCFKPK